MTRQKNTIDLHLEKASGHSYIDIDVCELQQHKITLPRSSDLPLEAMSVSMLAERCIDEMSKYRRGEAHTERYCIELFRRALAQRDAPAWEVMQERFHETMLRWMCGHPMRDIACRFDSEENYVAQAFARFWLATTGNQQVEFQSVGAVLRYLRMSLHSVILDALRVYSRPKEVIAVISVLPTCSFIVVSSQEKSSASAHRSLVTCRKSITCDATSWNGCCVMQITFVGGWANKYNGDIREKESFSTLCST